MPTVYKKDAGHHEGTWLIKGLGSQVGLYLLNQWPASYIIFQLAKYLNL